jgi:hypothetical protein
MIFISNPQRGSLLCMFVLMISPFIFNLGIVLTLFCRRTLDFRAQSLPSPSTPKVMCYFFCGTGYCLFRSLIFCYKLWSPSICWCPYTAAKAGATATAPAAMPSPVLTPPYSLRLLIFGRKFRSVRTSSVLKLKTCDCPCKYRHVHQELSTRVHRFLKFPGFTRIMVNSQLRSLLTPKEEILGECLWRRWGGRECPNSEIAAGKGRMVADLVECAEHHSEIGKLQQVDGWQVFKCSTNISF